MDPTSVELKKLVQTIEARLLALEHRLAALELRLSLPLPAPRLGPSYSYCAGTNDTLTTTQPLGGYVGSSYTLTANPDGTINWPEGVVATPTAK